MTLVCGGVWGVKHTTHGAYYESLSGYPEGFFVWWCVKHATHDAYYESLSGRPEGFFLCAGARHTT